MTEVIIRDLIESDIEECIEMLIVSYPWTAFGLTRDKAMPFFKERLDKELIYVAVYEGKVAGFIAIKRDILFLLKIMSLDVY